MVKLNLNRIVEILQAAGIPAFVEHSGGGHVTIYAGPHWKEPGGDTRYAVLAGPGTVGDPPTGITEAFNVGRDDDGLSEAWFCPPDADEEFVARRIAAEVRRATEALRQAGGLPGDASPSAGPIHGS